ncbi:MAG: hypothetical protein QOE51_2323 [Actinoplanes sp.]|jgi:hypothetical protein|nr:hypothetical protein [Actinoplanes sp.]
MFATIKSLIPEPRHADQPRHYIGRHREPETVSARATVTGVPRLAVEDDGLAVEDDVPAVEDDVLAEVKAAG